MPLTRKRRASANQDQSPPQRRRLTQGSQSSRRRSNAVAESSAQAARRRREPSESEAEEVVEPPSEGEEEVDELATGARLIDGAATHNRNQLVKKLIRFALASEYTRQPIRRSDISSKVLGHHGRMFNDIFDMAQRELQRVFGMALVELPAREKTKLSQRRAATNVDKNPTTSKSYVLLSTLPAAFRDPEILNPQGFREQTYTGLVSMIVSLVYLNGRTIPEAKLDRYLKRMNADEYTPIDKTEKILQTMVRLGYLLKVKDDTGEVTAYEYHLGPRAKVEIGVEGVEGLVKSVYGVTVPGDVEAKIRRNIGVELKELGNGVGPSSSTKKRRPGRPRNGDDE
ncbi:hypothetical protein RUND412_008856 [Rhizina undulata]